MVRLEQNVKQMESEMQLENARKITTAVVSAFAGLCAVFALLAGMALQNDQGSMPASRSPPLRILKPCY
jgi:hypothetical protein